MITAEKADIVIISDAIYTGQHKDTLDGFVAVKDNTIMAVGDKKDMESVVGSNTQVFDYTSKFVMPGFFDSHTHVIMAGMYQTHVNLGEAKSEDEAAQMVKKFAERVPNDPWIIGFNWYHVYWENKKLPTKLSLDKYIKDRPVFLLNAEAHGAWVNSKALEIAGINRETMDPTYGEIERFENGDPTGYLYEEALGLIGKYALTFSEEKEEKMITKYMEGASRYGITSVNDMQPYFGMNLGSPDVYKSIEKKGELTVRVHAAPDLSKDVNEIKQLQEKYNSEKFKITLLKQFVDGVLTTFTALLIDEYSDRLGFRGNTLNNINNLRKWIESAHKEAISVRLHACGDGAVRAALDCFECAIKKFGKNSARHGIEHIEVLHPEDINRFKDLGIIASMQPEHLAITHNFKDNPYTSRLGPERCKYTWPIKTLLRSGAVVAFGSDCPVVDNNPFLEIYRAVTRVHNDGKPKGGWNQDEKLTIEEALHAYTYGSAYGVGRENEIGTIEEGKLADLIVLDRNLFEIDVEAIRSTEVEMTLMNGEIVFKKLMPVHIGI
ncbi:MAG: amidohydrolase [Clostridia bacterium]|nr:amidohydrolase [Clostridia bacterium]